MPKIFLPKDHRGDTIPLTPNTVALEETVNGSLNTTQEVTLQSATKIIRCYATEQDVFLKWGTSDATTSDFDEVCPVGQIVDFVVPTGITAVNFIERNASASLVMIEK